MKKEKGKIPRASVIHIFHFEFVRNFIPSMISKMIILHTQIFLESRL